MKNVVAVVAFVGLVPVAYAQVPAAWPEIVRARRSGSMADLRNRVWNFLAK
jgi:hypothetical protein